MGARPEAAAARRNEGVEDVQTIAFLAPNANVIVYDVPDLSDASIIDAYNQVLSDGKADVVSSSFGGCEFGYDR